MTINIMKASSVRTHSFLQSKGELYTIFSPQFRLFFYPWFKWIYNCVRVLFPEIMVDQQSDYLLTLLDLRNLAKALKPSHRDRKKTLKVRYNNTIFIYLINTYPLDVIFLSALIASSYLMTPCENKIKIPWIILV